MKYVMPRAWREFRCIAERCRHTCCVGWEIDVDEDSLARFCADPVVSSHIEHAPTPHIRLEGNERCPFLNDRGLCELILTRGEDFLCQICRDHPRFRNFWSDRVEIGLGLVCEEAARLILFSDEPLTLETTATAPGGDTPDDAEQALRALRDELLAAVTEQGPKARLREYLLYRHLADALYDGRVDERLAFIDRAFHTVTALWAQTDGDEAALIDIARQWSYDVEYDDEELARQLNQT